MTVQSRQSLNRAVVAGGIFILFMTGVAFAVGALSNVYFAQHEKIACKVVNDNVLLDPGSDGKAKLTLVSADAPESIKARAKSFISYRLPDESENEPLHYVLRSKDARISKRLGCEYDEIQPRLIAVMRTVSLGTTMQGNTDVIIPNYVSSAMPKWFGIIFLLTLLSAAMSTLSSQFHTMGTAIGRDVMGQFSKDHSKTILFTRLGIIIGIIVAIVVGKMVRGNIIALATAIFFGLCAAAFLPTFVAGLFWKRMTRSAAIASLLVGFLTSTFWSVFVNGKTAAGLGICKTLFGADHLVPATWSLTWTVVDPLIVSLPLAALTAVIVALLTKPMDKDYVNYCYGGPKPVK